MSLSYNIHENIHERLNTEELKINDKRNHNLEMIKNTFVPQSA